MGERMPDSHDEPDMFDEVQKKEDPAWLKQIFRDGGRSQGEVAPWIAGIQMVVAGAAEVSLEESQGNPWEEEEACFPAENLVVGKGDDP